MNNLEPNFPYIIDKNSSQHESYMFDKSVRKIMFNYLSKNK